MSTTTIAICSALLLIVFVGIFAAVIIRLSRTSALNTCDVKNLVDRATDAGAMLRILEPVAPADLQSELKRIESELTDSIRGVKQQLDPDPTDFD